MKRAWSLRKQIFILMSTLAAMQAGVLVIVLILSRVFVTLDAEAFRVFETTVKTRGQTFNDSIGELIANVVAESENFSQEVMRQVSVQGMEIDELYTNQSLFEDLGYEGAETLFSLLENKVTGAYIVLNGDFNQRESETHSAIYLRNSAPWTQKLSKDQLLMEIGPSYLAQDYTIPLSMNWDMVMDFDGKVDSTFYSNTFNAVGRDPGGELVRYGYWTSPSHLLRDGHKAITYSLPLLDQKGQPFGVIGVEIALSYFMQEYLPNQEIPFDTSFYALTKDAKEGIDLDWYIPSGPLAELYLDLQTILPIKEIKGSNLKSVNLRQLGDMYCYQYPIKLYSDNSPFYEEGWTLTGFVSKADLRLVSSGVKMMLIGSIIIVTFLSIIIIFVLSYSSTRKISLLSDSIKRINHHQEVKFKQTGLKEIDELTHEIEVLNKKVIDTNKQLIKEVDYDPLTNLNNRRAFQRKVTDRLKKQPDTIGAMIFADLDNLKYVNDTYGHDVGDRYIISAAQLFSKFASHDGIVGRISGDEFVIYLHGYKTEEEIIQLIQKELEQTEDVEILLSDGTKKRLSYSAGVAYYPKQSDNVLGLLKCSDRAMYVAKEQGRGKIIYDYCQKK